MDEFFSGMGARASTARKRRRQKQHAILRCADCPLGAFVGQTNLARQTIESAKQNRIAAQIEPDGRQPHELTRADSFGYSRFNLQALFALATLGEHVGVDLWHFQTPEGAGIRKALDFLMPYVEEPEKQWPDERTKKAIAH